MGPEIESKQVLKRKL
uniref:Uncharacterized protein n=1 Tax=Rhizophora mucronata TaxID=61149 RepID=A0A2P2QKK2_RHIMU